MTDPQPLRVLHVLGGMNRGGVETWLMHVLRQIDRTRTQMDFLVHTTQPCAYDEELLGLGSRILRCPHTARPWRYGPAFRRLLAEHGPYDVVHSHIHFASGYVVRLARQAGVPVRLVHSHNDTSVAEARAGLLRRAYLGLMRRWIDRHATGGLACSQAAAVDLYGPAWRQETRWRLQPYGIDLSPFHDPIEPLAIRTELGVPPGAFVVGHVGRFVEQKNHAFLLEVAARLVGLVPNLHLLLVGEGELRDAVARQAAQLGLTGRITFTGSRPDVPRLMRGAMDVFVFPSRHEGLGIVLVEAQAAGLPSVIADVVPEEADVVPGLVRRLSLNQPAAAWAEAVRTAGKVSRTEALEAVTASPFNIQTGVRTLEEVYRDCVERARSSRRLARV